jgi:nitrate reductase NapE component
MRLDQLSRDEASNVMMQPRGTTVTNLLAGRLVRPRHRTKKMRSAILAVFALFPLFGCAMVDAGGSYGLCTWGQFASARYGHIGMQQASRGGAIQWVFYPATNLQGTTYRVKLYVNGRNQGGLEKPYAPHGSLPASAVKTGDTVEMNGKSYRGSKLVLSVSVLCEA